MVSSSFVGYATMICIPRDLNYTNFRKKKISEYEKIRAVNVKQKDKLLRKLKRDWDEFKEDEGILTGGRRKGARKLKVVEKEALNLGSKGEDRQSGRSTKQDLGTSGTGLDNGPGGSPNKCYPDIFSSIFFFF